MRYWGGVWLIIGRKSSTDPCQSTVLPDRPPDQLSDEHSHAEILLWQGRYRATFIPLVGFSTITLKWFGVISVRW